MTIADICRVVGIGGGKHLEVCPLGWLSPLLAAVTGFASLTAEDKPLRPQILALLITQYEPNLLLVASGAGAGRARAEGIAKWFGLSTHDRCMLTGMPGERQLINGKPMTLSGAAMVIARDDPDRLHQLIYGRSARLAA
ncbi:hypothetical protein [Frigidibacter sp. MR17.24]|uniref:hypothetical protein n=1 Tax=Frigidibacter sp. MR17.24 TaxID=3127345 RepID=UPI003012DA8B